MVWLASEGDGVVVGVSGDAVELDAGLRCWVGVDTIAQEVAVCNPLVTILEKATVDAGIRNPGSCRSI